MIGNRVVEFGEPAIFVDSQHDQPVADAEADPVAATAHGHAFAEIQVPAAEDWRGRHEHVVVEAELKPGLREGVPCVRGVDSPLGAPQLNAAKGITG